MKSTVHDLEMLDGQKREGEQLSYVLKNWERVHPKRDIQGKACRIASFDDTDARALRLIDHLDADAIVIDEAQTPVPLSGRVLKGVGGLLTFGGLGLVVLGYSRRAKEKAPAWQGIGAPGYPPGAPWGYAPPPVGSPYGPPPPNPFVAAHPFPPGFPPGGPPPGMGSYFPPSPGFQPGGPPHPSPAPGFVPEGPPAGMGVHPPPGPGILPGAPAAGIGVHSAPPSSPASQAPAVTTGDPPSAS